MAGLRFNQRGFVLCTSFKGIRATCVESAAVWRVDRTWYFSANHGLAPFLVGIWGWDGSY